MYILEKIKNRLVKLLLPQNYLNTYSMRARLYRKFLLEQRDFNIVKNLIESNAFFKPNDITVKMTPDASNILIFSPHQDDDIIGCGGTILNSLKTNANIQVVYVMDGVSPKLHGTERSDMVEVRKHEAKTVWARLNDNIPIFLGIPTRGSSININDSVQQITNIITAFSPDCIFVPYFLESPLDHRRATFLIWKSLRQINTKNIKEIWSYQVNTMISPNIAIDITESEPQKFELMGLWKSQNSSFNYQHRARGINAANSVYAVHNKEHAEPYIELFHTTAPKDFLKLLEPYYQHSDLF
jgi:LmbE family N-acetylglucosaminyl deacetylase